MIPLAIPSVSDDLSLEETLARLAASPLVDGLAEFGSRAAGQDSLSSDYDLLILAHNIPARVFQMVTAIGGRLADIVLVDVETADAFLLAGVAPEPRSFEGLFARKMQIARILYDPSGRLHEVRELVTGETWPASAKGPFAADLHAAWFWQSFGLVQLERLAQSHDQIHLIAFDMMLTSCLPGTWRAYFDVRGHPWEGEKAALRHWAEHDAGYMRILHKCLEAGPRTERLAVYRELVTRTLAPVGAPFLKGTTAAILADPAAGMAGLERTLRFWNALFEI